MTFNEWWQSFLMRNPGAVSDPNGPSRVLAGLAWAAAMEEAAQRARDAEAVVSEVATAEAAGRAVSHVGPGPEQPERKFAEFWLQPYSTWTHARGGTYTFQGTATETTNGLPYEGRRLVLYVSHTYQELKAREINEFLDGRFEPVRRPG